MEKEDNQKQKANFNNAADSNSNAPITGVSLKAPVYQLSSSEENASDKTESDNSSDKLISTAEDNKPNRTLESLNNSNINFYLTSELTGELEAKAFTHGNNIIVPNNFDFNNKEDLHILAHEISHVIQNKGGTPKKTNSVNGYDINDDKSKEADADAGARQILKDVSSNELQSFVQDRLRNGKPNMKKGVAQRVPLHGSRTYDSAVENHINSLPKSAANNKDYDEVKDRFFADIRAQVIENIKISKIKVNDEFIKLNDVNYLRTLMAYVREGAQRKEVMNNLKQKPVGIFNYGGDSSDPDPRQIKYNFDPAQKPSFKNIVKAKNPKFADRWEELKDNYNKVNNQYGNAISKSPIIFALLESNIGSKEKFLTDTVNAKLEGKKVLLEILYNCDSTAVKVNNGSIHPLVFEPVVQLVSDKKYKNKINYVEAIKREKAFIDGSINALAGSLTLILGIVSGLATGGMSALAMGTALVIDSGIATKSYVDYNNLNAAGKATSDKKQQLVFKKQVSDAGVDMIVNIGGLIIGFATDGREIFRYVKSADKLKVVKSSAKVFVNLGDPNNLGEQIKAAGGWKKFAKTIANNEKVSAQLMKFRENAYMEIVNIVESNGGKISRTGTVETIFNDLDASVLGPKSTEIREKIYEFMQTKYGLAGKKDVLEFLNMGLFGESKLKYAYDTLSGRHKAKVMNQSFYVENSFILNRQHTFADTAKEKAKFKKIMDDAGIDVINFKPLNEKQILEFNKQIDKHYVELLKATSDDEKADIIMKINEKLSYVDISDPDSYHTGAGLKQVNAGRKVNDTDKFKWQPNRKLRFTGGEKGSVVMAHYSSYCDYVSRFAKNNNDVTAMRHVGKTGDRCCQSLIKKLDKRKAKVLNPLQEEFRRIKIKAEDLAESNDPQKLAELKKRTSDAIKKLDEHLEREIPLILEHNNKMLKRINKHSGVNLKSVAQIQEETSDYFKMLAMRKDFKELFDIAKNIGKPIATDKGKGYVKDKISDKMKQRKDENNYELIKKRSTTKPKKKKRKSLLFKEYNYPTKTPNKPKGKAKNKTIWREDSNGNKYPVAPGKE